MYCSTCGAQVANGRTSCQVCGAAVARVPQPVYGAQPSPYGVMAPAASMPVGEPMAVCPRCGYRGQSVSYFSRGGHTILLVVLSALTWLAAGLVYYLLRHDHRVCPRCGEDWGKHGQRALVVAGPGGAAIPMHDDMPALPGGGSGKSVGATLLFVFAAFMLFGGLVSLEFAPILMGLMAGGGGYLLQTKARADRERRREALIQSLQMPVLKLAASKGGRLTVTQVATEMGWPIPRAEKVLNSLEDGFRVMSDITPEGVIVYDFLELRGQAEARGELPRPPSPALPPDNQLRA